PRSDARMLIEYGDAFCKLMLSRVRQASSDISLCTKTLEFDAFGQALLSELEYACQRGLQVRCLIDSRASARFIHRHPVLLTKLETQFRIGSLPADAANISIFDRRFALSGAHDLCQPTNDTDRVSRTVEGTMALALAEAFE